MLETHSTKPTAVGESKNARVWERKRFGDFTAFFFKKIVFLGRFWSKFLLKTAFLNG